MGAVSTVWLLAACGSGSSPVHVPPPVTAITSHAASAGTGLIGTIDRARVEAVCENMRQAQTALETGLGDATVDPFVTAAAGLLERPPMVASAQAAGARVRLELRRGRRDLAVAELTRFCQANAG